MTPDHLLGSARALPPDEAIAHIRRRLDEGGEAGDLATSDVLALLAAHDRYREAALTSDSAAEREAIVWADRVVALEARVAALRTMLAAARRDLDQARDSEYSTGAPGPAEEYLAEIDAELAAVKP